MIQSFLKWAQGTFNPAQVKDITPPHFRRAKYYFIGCWMKDFPAHLKRIGFVDVNDIRFEKGFTVLDIKSGEIWHKGVSTKRTKIIGDISDYIKNFDRI